MRLKSLLAPFEYLYFIVTSVRNFLYDKEIFKVHKFQDLNVISVGNISVGGSGKTPLVIYICKKLIKEGKNIAVVTRGYRSKIKKGVHEINERDTSTFVGDEPFMIFKNLNSNGLTCKVVVSPKRVDGIKYIKDSYNDIDTIILDDAMQHRAVFRNSNILCIDVGSQKARNDFLQNKLLPQGFLREKREQGLKRATHVVLNYRSPKDETESAKEDIYKIKKVISASVPVYECFIKEILINNYKYEAVNIKKDIIVFCAISKPINFIKTLEYFGYNIIDVVTFLDHKEISADKLEEMYKEATRKNVSLVCTEKDFVKLNSKWQEKIFFVKIFTAVLSTQFKKGDIL